MRAIRTPLLRLLSFRVRMIVIGVGLISMILPPYVPASSMVPANLPDEESQVLLVEEGFLMKTSPLTEAGDQTLYAKGFYYTVEDNDNITSIAKLHNIAVDTIRWANNLQPNSTLKPGQKLWILPVDGVVHRVQRGQNLTKIADLYGIDADKIRKQNKLEGSYLIAGQELIIPGGKPIPPSAPATAIAVKPPSNNPAVTRTLPEKPLSVRRQLYEGPGPRTLQKPCDCYVTQYFSASHFALDMQRRDGNGGFGGPVYAAAPGKVIRAEYGWDGGYGNVIEIDHGNGLVTLYAHNKALHVSVGDEVAAGQYISDMGRTGLVYGPTGIHVHFEVRVNGVKRNPLLYLQ